MYEPEITIRYLQKRKLKILRQLWTTSLDIPLWQESYSLLPWWFTSYSSYFALRLLWHTYQKGTHYGRGHWVHFFSLFWSISQEESTTAGAIGGLFLTSLILFRSALAMHYSRLILIRERITAGATIFPIILEVLLMAGCQPAQHPFSSFDILDSRFSVLLWEQGLRPESRLS